MSVLYICGKRGSGKTCLVKRHIIPLWGRVVVLDSLGFEYEYFSADTFIEFQQNLKHNLERENFRLTYNPMNDEYEKLFFKECLSLYNCLLVIEETDIYCTPYQIDPSLDRLIRYGRHRNIDLCFISRRPAEVHRNVTAQSDYILSFKQTEPRDLEYFKKITDDWDTLKHLDKWKYGHKMIKDKHFKVVLENEDLKIF